MDIIKKQLSTTDKNGNEKAIHLETSAELVKMTGFYTLSSLSGLITDTDNALQALKKLQTNISNIKVFSGTDGSSAGTSGLVIAPSILDKDKFLKSDGTWSKISSAETANQLSSPVNLQVNLSSIESSSFNGSSDTLIGVTGVLPIENGGTNASTLPNARKSLLGESMTTSNSKYFLTVNDNWINGGCLSIENVKSVLAINNVNNTADSDKIVAKANQLTDSINLITDLASSERVSFNGSQDTAIGVTGTLPISSGGTGATSLNNITVGKANQLHYTECFSDSNIAEKSVDCTNFVLEKGVRVSVLFTITNTAENPTLNVNSTGAKPIYYRGYPIPASAIQANSLYDLIYNGSQWLIVGSVLWTE